MNFFNVYFGMAASEVGEREFPVFLPCCQTRKCPPMWRYSPKLRKQWRVSLSLWSSYPLILKRGSFLPFKRFFRRQFTKAVDSIKTLLYGENLETWDCRLYFTKIPIFKSLYTNCIQCALRSCWLGGSILQWSDPSRCWGSTGPGSRLDPALWWAGRIWSVL